MPIPPAQPLITQGKVVALGSARLTALIDLPTVPALKEAGYSIDPYLFWCGLSAPANTPRGIVDKLNAAIWNVLIVPGVQTRFRQMGFTPMLMKPEQYGKFVADDMTAMIQLGKDAHIESAD